MEHVREAQRVANEVATTLGAPELGEHRHLVSRARIALVAEAYRQLPDRQEGFELYWDAMAREVQLHLDALLAAGFSVEVSDTDPYATAGDMMRDVAIRRILVLSTASTGGHPYWTNEQNDAFRAVHDVLGHCRAGRGFDRHGEEAALFSHRQMFSAPAQLALLTETRGQNHAMIAAGGEFQPEKLAVLPEWARALRLPPTAGEFYSAWRQSERFDREAGIA